ncbi:MAG: hypothetical protein M2R46_05038 [Verrucomicrobia subdivision 3 bacterium]|nr:hypothetical protein [Limisphaerales bacterium]
MTIKELIQKNNNFYGGLIVGAGIMNFIFIIGAYFIFQRAIDDTERRIRITHDRIVRLGEYKRKPKTNPAVQTNQTPHPQEAATPPIDPTLLFNSLDPSELDITNTDDWADIMKKAAEAQTQRILDSLPPDQRESVEIEMTKPWFKDAMEKMIKQTAEGMERMNQQAQQQILETTTP